MYCRNCGKKVAEKAEICVDCGISPKKGTRYCQSCGEEATPIKVKEVWCTICASVAACSNPNHPKRDIMSTNEFCSKCGVRWRSGGGEGKDWLTTMLLAIFLGGLGIHRFYTGHTGTAIAQLALFLVGLPLMTIYIGVIIELILGIWVLIDIIRIATGSFEDSNGNLLVKR